LDNLLLQEESLWRNKSREPWLTCKDLNKKFFHTSTIIKRRRNAIDFLRLPSGVWSSEQQEIGNCFTSHFQSVFNSSRPNLDEDLLSLFDNCMSPEENASIYEIPTEQEIFMALSEMGSTKALGQMVSLHCSTKNIGILSKMRFSPAYGIFLGKIIF
jgi:hypothetical protein